MGRYLDSRYNRKSRSLAATLMLGTDYLASPARTSWADPVPCTCTRIFRPQCRGQIVALQSSRHWIGRYAAACFFLLFPPPHHLTTTVNCAAILTCLSGPDVLLSVSSRPLPPPSSAFRTIHREPSSSLLPFFILVAFVEHRLFFVSSFLLPCVGSRPLVLCRVSSRLHGTLLRLFFVPVSVIGLI